MNNPSEVIKPAGERALRDGLRGVLNKQLSYLSDRSNRLLGPYVDSFIAGLKLGKDVISCAAESPHKFDFAETDKKNNSSLFLEKTTLGTWTLKCLDNNTSSSRYKYLHSRIDPLKEAKRQLTDQHITGRESHLVLLGMDLLYLLEAITLSKIANSAHPKQTLIIFTQSVEVLLLTFAIRELAWLNYFEGRIEVYLSDHSTNSHDDTTTALVSRQTRFHSWLFISTREAEFFNTGKTYYTKLQHELLKLGQTFYRTALTRYAFEKRWLKNILSNMRYLNKCHPFANLHNHYTDGIAIIIGAGPSLDTYKDDLRDLDQLRNEFFQGGDRPLPYASSVPIFIALDSALPTLAAMNIKPDYIVALDGGYYNTFDFSWANTFPAARFPAHEHKLREDKISEKVTSKKRTIPKLLTHIGVYPTILRDYAGKIYTFTEAVAPSAYDTAPAKQSLTASVLKMIDLNLTTSQIAIGGSVLHAALGCTLAMGFSKIIFYGIDFACPYYWSHARHAIHNQYLLHKSDRFHSLTSEVFKYLKPTIITEHPHKSTPASTAVNDTHSDNLFFTTQTLLTYADKLDELLQSFLIEQQRSISALPIDRTVKPAVPMPSFYTVSPYAPRLKALTFLSNFNAVSELLADHRADHRADDNLATKKLSRDLLHKRMSIISTMPTMSPITTEAEPLMTAATLNERILKIITTLDDLCEQTERTMNSLVEGLRTSHDGEQHEKTKHTPSEATFNTLLEKIPAAFGFVKILLQTYQPLIRDPLEQRYHFLMVTELRRIFHITATKLRFLLSQQ